MFFVNRLIVDLSGWSFVFLCSNLFSIFSFLYYLRMINDLALLSNHAQVLLNDMFLWLDVSFSDSGSSRNSNWNCSSGSLSISDCILSYFFSVNRSSHSFLSDNWCLNNSLFDDGLRNNLFSDDWLRNNCSLDDWLRNDLLSLDNLRSAVKNLSFCLTYEFSSQFTLILKFNSSSL